MWFKEHENVNAASIWWAYIGTTLNTVSKCDDGMKQIPGTLVHGVRHAARVHTET